MQLSGPSRRTLLLGGLAGVAGTVLSSRLLQGATGPAAAGALPARTPGSAEVAIETVASAARGRDVTLVTVRPAGAGDVPAVLYLHGRYGDARDLIRLGVPERLGPGGPGFAVAALDGGDAYWHPRGGDDPLRMLTDELPGWLATRGLAAGAGGLPSAVCGISMGGFGALRYARARGGPHDARGLRAVAVLSPALFERWGDARTRDAFAGRADWAAHEPLQHLPALAGTPLGVWCGEEDPFAAAARRLARAVPGALERISAGAHTMAYWRSVLPDVLDFLAGHGGP